MTNVLQSPGRLSRPRERRWVRWTLAVVAVVALLAVLGIGGFVWWGSTPSSPTPVAAAALRGSGTVTVTEIPNGWAFSPKLVAGQPTGWVLYPGGHVDARAYAPLALAVAERGFTVALVKAPLSIAFLDINAADVARRELPTVKAWAVGGHSLGGVAASSYVASHPGQVYGLILLASYPAQGTDLSGAKGPDGQPLRVLSMHGSLDGLATQAKIDAARPLLPAGTEYVTITGGNHAQWGAYGPQQGDNPATISAAQQLKIATDTIAAFLVSL
jgi:predicted esterase